MLEGLNRVKSGKVRDLYELGEYYLIVASDRISAFDVILPTPIPDKGKILTKMSLFWFNFLGDIVKNHLVTADVDEYPPECRAYRDYLDGRSMLVLKASPLPVECIVRGYLAGSAWNEYQNTGKVCGIPLKSGLLPAQKLDEPIFTPSTKAIEGHDENIDFERTREILGDELASKVRDLSISIYKKASEYALTRGIIIADTKFEFGIHDNELILIDEVLTPDSSRFWPLEGYEPGRPQPSFDKQFVRDYLISLGWDKKPPAPPLPDNIVQKTRERYLEAYKRLTGEDLF